MGAIISALGADGRDQAMIHFFHGAADPYSDLAIQVLPLLAKRYEVEIQAHRVSPPGEAAAPDPERLAGWALRDVERLIHGHGLARPGPAETLLREFDAADDVASGDALREQLGHYSSGMFTFEGRWYWGIDRLHYLERDLRAKGLERAGAPEGFIVPPRDITLAPFTAGARRPVLHVFPSFRSPYSYIALARVRALAEHYGAEVRLRFVLPMVMRGLPVPPTKSFYIVGDTKREADRLGLRFGPVVDPVGPGVERGLAVLHHAIPAGLGLAFAESFLQGAFADGIDATKDEGLMQMADRAGLTADQVQAALADPSWREVAEANRREMLDQGLWGVPSFRVDDRPLLWGQDRLWMVEDDLRAALAA
jgi:2-hydroxychromene-2-carboxylate isomerase